MLMTSSLLRFMQGRVLLWGWLSELANPGAMKTDYAGCISLPRSLSIHPEDGRLVQHPLPELRKLHGSCGESCNNLEILPGKPV
jgi:sucrose-6-phosphate hydrolase SacC (GH32 family)